MNKQQIPAKLAAIIQKKTCKISVNRIGFCWFSIFKIILNMFEVFRYVLYTNKQLDNYPGNSISRAGLNKKTSVRTLIHAVLYFSENPGNLNIWISNLDLKRGLHVGICVRTSILGFHDRRPRGNNDGGSTFLGEGRTYIPFMTKHKQVFSVSDGERALTTAWWQLDNSF